MSRSPSLILPVGRNEVVQPVAGAGETFIAHSIKRCLRREAGQERTVGEE